VVTGTIIAVIGISLMRVGVGWATGGPAPLAQRTDIPKLVEMVDKAKAAAVASSAQITLGPIPLVDNPGYGALDNLAIAAAVLVFILLLVKYAKGFFANISVLLGIVAGCIVAAFLGKMNFDKVAKAPWLDVVTPFAFGMPTFDAVMILTMVLVMIVVMIESTGMFLALSEITGKPISRAQLSAGLRTDGLGTLLGGIFNTFPYTSFSQNVGLVAVTGVKSRYVCAAGGVIMIVLGLVPKMGAFVEAIPQFVLGGAGLVMFGMVAATGIRILSTVDFRTNRYNLYIVALSIGFGLIPLVAPRWMQQMTHGLHPLLESGILLTSIAAVVLNLYFNGLGSPDTREAIGASKVAEAH
jgi:NCS2 family nucleobase:cation symporter-2